MQYYRPTACLTALGLIGESAIEDLPNRSFPREMPGGKPVLLLKKFRNHGLPFGFLEKCREVVKYGPPLVECLVLPRLSRFLSRRGRRIEGTTFALVLAGDGNDLFDRLSRGHVADYFSSTPKKLCHLIFNLGDLCIAAGMVVLSATEFVRGLRCIGMKGVKH